MSLESPGEDKNVNKISEELHSLSLIVPETVSDNNESRTSESLMLSIPPMAFNTENYSENESEASSVGFCLKKINLTPQHRVEPDLEKTRAIRSATIKRAVSLPRTTIQPTKHLTPLRQNNKTNAASFREPACSTVGQCITPARLQTRTTKPQKPNSLPQVQSRAWKPAGVASGGSIGNATKKVINTNAPMDRTSFRIRSSLLSVELKSTTNSQSLYGTMPRRRKQKSIDDLQDGRMLESRSQSVNRDTHMTASIGPGTRKQLQLNCSGASSNSSSAWTTPTQPYPLHWPNFNKQSDNIAARKQNNSSKAQRTRIFYEQSVQTSITNNDMIKLMSGEFIETRPALLACDSSDRETQCSDIRDNELQTLRDEVRNLNASLQRERDEKVIMQRELQLNTERVMGMLELARVNSINGSAGGWTPTSEDDASSCSVSGHDSLLMLESQIQLSGHELNERQQEIRQLRQLCRSLQSEMERSVAAQQFLLQEKAAIEEESNEMQDFLQHEKVAMFEALRELECDYENCKAELTDREEDVRALREKCRYLVRSNEQRRQENLLLQTKYSVFKSKFKDLISYEHSTIIVAYSALSKLHLRLKSLVDELKLTYNISEQDLELQIAQLNDNSDMNSLQLKNLQLNDSKENVSRTVLNDQNQSIMAINDDVDGDDDGALSPERHKSFIAAIIGAIRSAATPNRRSLQNSTTDCRNSLPPVSASASDQSSNGNGNGNGNSNGNGNGNGNGNANAIDGEMLDSETEPCLMMDNVLLDVDMPDTYTNNLISNADNEIVLNDSISFHNLSQAIVNRQNIEKCTNDAMAEELPDINLTDVKALIEKVNDVDTLVTRLLRLIQMDNDNCIQQLIVDKNKLQQHKEEMLDKIRELQEVNMKLQDDLMDATQELMLKNNEIEGKKELQSHHSEIDFSEMQQTSNSRLHAEKVSKMMEAISLSESSTCNNEMEKTDQSAEYECDVMEVMDILSKVQSKNSTDDALNPLIIRDLEGNVQNKLPELPSPNQLEDILNTFDTVDSLDDIDAEVQQTIKKLRENWSTLCLSNEDLVDSNAN